MTEPSKQSDVSGRRRRSDLLVVVGSFAVYLCPVFSGIETVSLGRVALDTIDTMLRSPQSFGRADSVMADLGTALAAQGLFGFILSWVLALPRWTRVVGFVASLPLIVAGVNYDYFIDSPARRAKVGVTGRVPKQNRARSAAPADKIPWPLKCTVDEEALLWPRQQIDGGFAASGRAWIRDTETREVGVLSLPDCRATHLNVSLNEYNGPLFVAADGGALWRMGDRSHQFVYSDPPVRDRLTFQPILSEITKGRGAQLTMSNDGKYLAWIKYGESPAGLPADVAVLHDLATHQEKSIPLPRGSTTRLLGVDMGAEELFVSQIQDRASVFFSLDFEGRPKGEPPFKLPILRFGGARRIAPGGWVAWGGGGEQGSMVGWSLPSGAGTYTAESVRVLAVHPEGRWIAVATGEPLGAAAIRVVRTSDGVEVLRVQSESAGPNAVFVGSEFFAYDEEGAVTVLRIDEG